MARDTHQDIPSIVPDIDVGDREPVGGGGRRRERRRGGSGGGGAGVWARLFIALAIVVAAVACAWAWQLQQQLASAESDMAGYASRIADLEARLSDTDEGLAQNAQAMAQVFIDRGYKVVSGGTENHLFLLDLVDKVITGKDAEARLGEAHITVNKNSVPNDPRSPFVTSGLRIGSPAVTRRGMKEAEVAQLTDWMCDILADIENDAVIDSVRDKVKALCARFPVYRQA